MNAIILYLLLITVNPQLTWDWGLARVADARAEHLCRDDVFNHDDYPLYVTRGGWSGENLAQGFSTPEAAHKALAASHGHYANMVRHEFESVGIGYTYCNGRNIYVQQFNGNRR